MEVITFGPDMDLSSKNIGDVFKLKMGDKEYNVKVESDSVCSGCVFLNGIGACSLSNSQDWCLKKQVIYQKKQEIMEVFNMRDAEFLWRQIGRIDGMVDILNSMTGKLPKAIATKLQEMRDDIDKFVDDKTKGL